jgi:putative RNA 2'-phosphotransferase
MNAASLSRVVSHALRHEPWLYELEPDEQGWVPIDALVASLRASGEWHEVTRSAVEEMVRASAKQRHEVSDGRIRATYGHSLPGPLVRVTASPPEVLFHGTSPPAWGVIARDGLRPMGRQHVHLSVDAATARLVGQRKSPTPVVLVCRARQAHDEGVQFLVGTAAVWLADAIPPRYLEPLQD